MTGVIGQLSAHQTVAVMSTETSKDVSQPVAFASARVVNKLRRGQMDFETRALEETVASIMVLSRNPIERSKTLSWAVATEVPESKTKVSPELTAMPKEILRKINEYLGGVLLEGLEAKKLKEKIEEGGYVLFPELIEKWVPDSLIQEDGLPFKLPVWKKGSRCLSDQVKQFMKKIYPKILSKYGCYFVEGQKPSPEPNLWDIRETIAQRDKLKEANTRTLKEIFDWAFENKRKETSLAISAHSRFPLLRQGISNSAKNDAETGNLDRVTFYAEWMSSWNESCSGLLVAASTCGHLNCVEALVPKAPDAIPLALKHAAEKGYKNIVEYLLKAAENSLKNSDFETAYTSAINNGQVNCAARILEKAGDRISYKFLEERKLALNHPCAELVKDELSKRELVRGVKVVAGLVVAVAVFATKQWWGPTLLAVVKNGARGLFLRRV